MQLGSEECCEQECRCGAKGLAEMLGRHDATREGGDGPSVLVAMNCYSHLAESLIFVLISSVLILHIVEVEKSLTNYFAMANGIYQVFVCVRIHCDLVRACNSLGLDSFHLVNISTQFMLQIQYVLQNKCFTSFGRLKKTGHENKVKIP